MHEGPFQPPLEPYRLSHIRAWSKHGGQIGDIYDVYGDLYQRFNTIQIPIYEETEYFDNALEIAKLAKGKKKDFERIYKQKIEERRKELLALMYKALRKSIHNARDFPSEEAAYTVDKVCKTGCFSGFVQLLKGISFGWEADVAEDAQPDNVASNPSETDEKEEMRGPNDLDRNEGLDIDELDLDDPCNREHWNNMDCPAQRDPEYDYYYSPEEWEELLEDSAKATFPLGQFIFMQSTEARPDETVDKAPSIQEPPPHALTSASTTEKNEEQEEERTQKRARSSPDIINNGEQKPQKSESVTAPSTPHSSLPTQKVADKEATRKRAMPYDDSDHSHKRQKLQSSSAHSPEPCASSSTQKAQNGSLSRKRAMPDDDSDHSHKRQKLQSADTPEPCASLSPRIVQDGSVVKKRARPDDDGYHQHKRRKLDDSTTPQVEDGFRPQLADEKGGCRHKRKSSTPRVRRGRPPASSVSKTRPIRRNGASSFWELDHLGKPRSVS